MSDSGNEPIEQEYDYHREKISPPRTITLPENARGVTFQMIAGQTHMMYLTPVEEDRDE